MSNSLAWEKEYRKPKLVSKDDKPQADTLRFFKFLKKEQKYNLEDKRVLDLGCGTGRNSNYLAQRHNEVCGIEISRTAIDIARERARKKDLKVDYILGDIAKRYDFPDLYFDLVLDVTSSNSLDEEGRSFYLQEVSRVLKNNSYFFVRALAKDASKNVKNLLKNSPGKEYDTYHIKEMGLTERVFSKEDFIKMYSKYFKIIKIDKKTSYTSFNGRVYKRNYWIAYLKKSV